jgi:phosphatidate cytidylyltransferase
MTAPRPRGLPLAVAAVVTGFLLAAWRIAPERAAWLFLVSGSFDGFAQVSGQLLGKHPLAPRISPAKTVEGMIGAFVGSLMVANWIRELPGFDVAAAVRIGLLIGVCALAGDLWGSWTKRRAGLKDFSQVLHGQGGVIDRFNSFVVAMALVGSWI